ncbi:curli-like amyloid fiber formation chaperone CsgH [Castellaniella sp.]|jgi:curli production protein|uniref:curli-like amyloid fiber formation chaperone CsgH n=1 Tax=Castellaniella sp. TaxID=1955812 RepID=UPI002D800571|nr:curli-like amyloid fiber formation chaperone CsgH [Castellaniella sp.]HET8704325.1 curli-like amyloid fiber formation chaperone CsgH [Castellaniella sp.]
MMAADLNLQVWLDSGTGAQAGTVVPYVQSPEDRAIDYRLQAIKQGPSGTSQITQSGSVALQANQPTALTRFSMSLGTHDQCQIELLIFSQGVQAGTYRFTCPRAH